MSKQINYSYCLEATKEYNPKYDYLGCVTFLLNDEVSDNKLSNESVGLSI